MLRFRLRHLNERVREARAQAEKSRRSLQTTREHVVTPNELYRERNHFSQLIRDSLLEGRDQ